MLDRHAVLGVVHSATGRRWAGPDADTERLGLAIAQAAGVPGLVGLILASRGVAPDEAEGYLSPTLRALMPDPSTLIGMDDAAGRLARAALRGERVALFGDYDVDGAASLALLAEWFDAAGIEATLYVPDRLTEGYGPNVPAMRRLGESHDLVVCLDCGTVAHEPVAAARAAGADVVVIDHHLPGEALPEAVAVVNPIRADCASGLGQLCAAGVAFLVLVAANRLLRAKGGAAPDLMAALDLVAVATVADVAPLTGLNRAFVRQGLAVMARRVRPGLAARADAAGLVAPPRSSDLGFVLGPRLNAGGRVGDATLAARLLTAPDRATAERLAAEVEAMNAARRSIEAEAAAAAAVQAEARLAEGAALAWAADPSWHPGVLGIVAGRLRERFGCPAVVLGGAGELLQGSARSVPGVDIGSSVAALAREGLIAKGGGHRMAAGLAVAPDRAAEAMAALAARLEAAGAGTAEPEALVVDGLVAPAAATPDLVAAMERAGPFGQSSPPPRVALAGVVPTYVKVSDKGHASLRLAGPAGRPLAAIAFGAGESGLARLLTERAAARGALHVAGRLEIDDWGGRRRAKLRLEDAADPC
ncbi:MAG: single-stranded-DNA-specific exonuclease RecJ [Paracoccaceae bacterium]